MKKGNDTSFLSAFKHKKNEICFLLQKNYALFNIHNGECCLFCSAQKM